MRAPATASRGEGNVTWWACVHPRASARIRELRNINPVAAHLRERRFELGRTLEQVARAVETSHTDISRMERGLFMPKLPTLQRIAAVLDEEPLICFQRTVDGEVERVFAPVR